MKKILDKFKSLFVSLVCRSSFVRELKQDKERLTVHIKNLRQEFLMYEHSCEEKIKKKDRQIADFRKKTKEMNLTISQKKDQISRVYSEKIEENYSLRSLQESQAKQIIELEEYISQLHKEIIGLNSKNGDKKPKVPLRGNSTINRH